MEDIDRSQNRCKRGGSFEITSIASINNRYKREQVIATHLDDKNGKIAANQYKCDKTMIMCAKK